MSRTEFSNIILELRLVLVEFIRKVVLKILLIYTVFLCIPKSYRFIEDRGPGPIKG